MAGFSSALGADFREGALVPREEELVRELVPRFCSAEWVLGKGRPQAARHPLQARVKCPGGLVRASLVLTPDKRRISTASLRGDFFAYPTGAVLDLEDRLRGAPAEAADVSEIVRAYFADSGASVPGMDGEGLARALSRALEEQA